MLEDRVDAAAIGRKFVETLAGHPDLTRIGPLETSENPQQSGFAGAALAQNGEKLAFGHIERDAIQDTR